MRDKSWLPWVPTYLAVVTLVFFTGITIFRLFPGHDRSIALPSSEPIFTLPGITSGPQVPVSLLPSAPDEAPSDAPSGDATPAGAGRAPTRRTEPAVIGTPPRTTRPTASAAVTGSYSVLNAYADNFIGQVLLTNRTDEPQDWVLTLTYPGSLRTSWLESLPQPTLVPRGNTFTWTSSVPLAANSSGQMRFQFDLDGGTKPSTCEVNGSSCW